jgi:hypothetical protein
MKGQALTFSPEQWEDIANRAARLLVDEIREEAGGLDALVTLPLQTVGQITGLSRATIPKRMPVVDAEGKLGVTLKSLREWQAKQTRQPLTLIPSR